MNLNNPSMHNGKSGAAITVKITHSGKTNHLTGVLKDGTIQVNLAAGKGNENTNKELLSFLGQVLDVKPNQLEIVAGESGADKLIAILNLDPQSVQERIFRKLPS